MRSADQPYCSASPSSGDVQPAHAVSNLLADDAHPRAGRRPRCPPARGQERVRLHPGKGQDRLGGGVSEAVAVGVTVRVAVGVAVGVMVNVAVKRQGRRGRGRRRGGRGKGGTAPPVQEPGEDRPGQDDPRPIAAALILLPARAGSRRIPPARSSVWRRGGAGTGSPSTPANSRQYQVPATSTARRDRRSGARLPQLRRSGPTGCALDAR